MMMMMMMMIKTEMYKINWRINSNGDKCSSEL